MNIAKETVSDRSFFSVVKPYSPDPASPRRRRRGAVILACLSLACLLYGIVFAFFAPYLLVEMLIPIVVLAALVVWALPISRTAPTRTLEFLFFGFFVASVVWPPYLAVALPGLPWITIARLTGVPLSIVFLVCLSTSTEFRAQLSAALAGASSIWKLMLVFVVIEASTLPLSINKGLSFDHLLTAQTSWTIPFFAGCYILAKPGRAWRWAGLAWGTAVFAGVIGAYEHHLGHVPWAGHIPAILKINDPSVAVMLVGGTRFGQHRVQSTFNQSIQLGEYMSLALPFIIHYAVTLRRPLLKLFAIASIILAIYTILLTQARTGMSGLIISTILYVLYWSYIQWRLHPQRLIGPFMLFSYPALAAVVGLAILFVGRIRIFVLGGGALSASTLARQVQMKMGIPKVLSHPFGHGIATAGQALGYYDPSGKLTIDSYYLSVALEFGFLGLIIYYGMFLWAIYTAGRHVALASPTHDETSLIAPVAIALTNFVVIKSVFSETDNHALVFMLLGMLVALLSRSRSDEIRPANVAPSDEFAHNAWNREDEIIAPKSHSPVYC
jgi:hypothetical protein